MVHGVEQRFRELAFRNPVPPGATVSGFVLTNLDEGVKMVQVDLIADGRLRAFSFMNDVPGFRADYHSREFLRDTYPAEEIVDYADAEAFRAAIEELPCCVTNKKGTRDGDPLNLVVVGGRDDAFPALVRRGWQPTEETWLGSVLRMAQSALAGERYRYAPKDMIHHSDRGAQYTSDEFRSELKRNGIHCSMSARANCYDNAVVESFFGLLKRECVNHVRFRTRDEARATVFEYIEVFYNRKRRHSYLGHVSPVDFENRTRRLN